MAKRAIDLSDEKDCELVPLPVLLVSTESSLESSLGSPAKSLAMSLEKECELVILPVLLPSIESSLESSLGSPAKSLASSMAMMSPVISLGTSLGSPAKSPASSMAIMSPVRSPGLFNTGLYLKPVTNVPLILCTYLYLIYIYILSLLRNCL